jgi:integrase
MDSTVKRPRGRPKGTGLGGRLRVFTPQELDALQAAAAKFSKKYDFIIDLTRYLALRVGELISLRADDVNEAAHQLTIKAEKQGFTKTYDLPDRLWRKYKAWMKDREPKTSPWLFPHRIYGDEHMADDSVQGTFRELCRRAGIPGRHSIHDLRHSAATTMAQAGDGIAQIAGWLRHRAIISSQRYISYQVNKEHEAKMKARYSQRSKK